MSNLTQDNNLKRPDTAQKTIEHSNDVEEEGDERRVYDDPSEFDHINNSPEDKLRSIDVDDDLTGRKQKGHGIHAAAMDSDGKSEADDNSGTGHRVSSTNKKLAGASEIAELQKLRKEANKSMSLIHSMRASFMNFKNKIEVI